MKILSPGISMHDKLDNKKGHNYVSVSCNVSFKTGHKLRYPYNMLKAQHVDGPKDVKYICPGFQISVSEISA